MSRRGQVKPREIVPDTRYNSDTIARIINYCMMDGRKSAATQGVYEAIDIVQRETKSDDILVTLEQALDSIKPKVEVRPRRIGGAVYQVPTPVHGRRQMSLAIRWLITSTRALSSKQYHSFGQKLASELLSALKNEGSSVNKRLEVERMADANKAFAHLRW
jgi:small subunit ribosomal protein S7